MFSHIGDTGVEKIALVGGKVQHNEALEQGLDKICGGLLVE